LEEKREGGSQKTVFNHWLYCQFDFRARQSRCFETAIYGGEEVGFQFAKLDTSGSQIQAVSQLQAIEWLRTTPEDNERRKDKITANKVAVKDQLQSRVVQYFGEEEAGALIGQENEILRLMHSVGYTEEEIDMVRDAFKTKDIFYRREVSQKKRRIMTQKNKGDVYQDTLRELVTIAKDISKHSESDDVQLPKRAESVLFYVKNNE
jgi:hypothetical protein